MMRTRPLLPGRPADRGVCQCRPFPSARTFPCRRAARAAARVYSMRSYRSCDTGAERRSQILLPSASTSSELLRSLIHAK